MSEDEKIPEILFTQSGVNPEGEPFLQLVHGDKVLAQFTPDEARDFARTIIEGAEAAEQDAFIFDWVLKKVGAGLEQATGLLVDFRRYRAERTGKRGGPSNPRDWTPPNRG